jgi:heme exporter protein D
MSAVLEFLDMGGYALYVWGSFVVTAVLMVAEPLMLRSRRRAVLKRVARVARMNAAEVKS